MIRFVIMDLIKSVGTAEKHGKWYQKYLDRGGRWVTITDEQSPLRGRHILIDSGGYIIGGRGIPKRIIDKLNGGHIDLTIAKYENTDRKNAVDETHKELGEQKIQDKKGTWTFHHVSRSKHDADGKHEYQFYVKHDKLPGQTGSGWGLHGGVHLRPESTIEDLKTRLKNASGYTPDKSTLEAMMQHFHKLRDAYDEQDRHYRDGDKEDAQKTVEGLLQTAIDRAKKGEMPGVEETSYMRNGKEHQKYLTKAEQEKLREAQKYLRGNSQYDASESNTGVATGMDNLHGFNSHVWNERVAHEKKLEAEAKDKRKQELDDRFESDVALRKLVAHAVAARKAVPDKFGSGAGERELAYRLFGYANNEDQARKANQKLAELESKLGLNSFELRDLVYRHKNDILPPVTPEHQREAGKIYFGDKVYSPVGTTHEVTKVGTKYLHLRGGIESEHGKNKLFETTENENRNPQNMEEARESVLHILHNHEYHGGAHLKHMEHVAKHLAAQSEHNRYKLDRLRKLDMHTENPYLKAALKEFEDEVRRHELTRMINGKGWAHFKDKLQNELDTLGPSNIDNVPEYKEQPKAAEPEPAPAPAPEPKPEPKPAGSGKEGKPVKLGYGDEATMHVPGSKDTFKHIKQLKHAHGGAWNGEANRWEFKHAHGSEGHKQLAAYASSNGLTLNLHDGAEGKGEPSPTPEPKPAGEGKEGKPAKLGYGDDATMHVPGSKDTFKHIKQLKHTHGGAWNSESNRWEFKHAPGSEGHKALEGYARANGLTLHMHDGAEGKGEPSPAPEPPKEPEKMRDFTNYSVSDLIKHPPTDAELNDTFGSDEGERVQQAKEALEEFKKNPHLVKLADEHIAYRKEAGMTETSTLRMIRKRLSDAKTTHEEETHRQKEAEEKRKREEALRDSYPKELEKADLSYLQKNPPTLEELQNFYKSRAESGPAHPAGGINGLSYTKTRDEAVKEKAQQVHDALREYLGNPKLQQHMGEHVLELLKNSVSKTSGGTFLDYFPSHLAEAKKRATTGGYTSKIGAKISLSPNDTVRVRGIKGAGTGDAHRIKITDPTNGRTDVKYVPTKWAGDKNRIAQTVPGVGQDGVDFIHHVLAGGKPEDFKPDENKVKPTSKFEKFAEVPNKPKEIDGFMDKAKGDLLAHGASDVAFTTKGTKEQRAKTAHIIATGFRALHHMLGGNLPPVSVTIGPTYSKALAHYSSGGRSIVIDPDKGQNSFFHEFGHFLDDAMHDFKRGNIGSRMSGEIHNPIGSRYESDYHEKSPMAELGKAIKETDTWKKRHADMEGKASGTKYGFSRDYRNYFNSDIESFARFFSQWAGHEGRKRGYDLPASLADPKETEWDYGEHYTPEELDKVGDVLKKVFAKKGLLKGLLAFLDALGGKQTRYVIHA